MAKNTKKLSKSRRSALKIEALEQRQLLAGGFTAAQGQEFSDIQHPNGNVYDQVLLKTSAITVTNDPGQITRVSFLDLQGDIVQAEFSGAGSLSISLDSFSGPAAAANYNQPGVQYVSGLASFTIQGSDASTYFSLWSVGTATAHGGAAAAIFEGGLTGGDNTVDAARLTIVANPANPSGSTFGGIAAANTEFSADSGVVGITAANVQVQNYVRIGDINATGTAVPTLVFGTASQFGAIHVAGGDLVSDNGKAINNTGSYGFGVTFAAGTTSGGTTIPAATASDDLIWSGTDPLGAVNQTIKLTTGIDSAVGGAGNDTFIAILDTAGGTSTLTGLDKIDGAGGTDTIDLADLDPAGSTYPGGLTISNVETFQVRGVGPVTIDTSAITGVTALNVTQGTAATITAASDTAVTVSGITTAGAVAINGGSTVTYSNTAGTGTVTVGGTTEPTGHISISGAKGAVTVDGKSSATVSTSAGAVDVDVVGATSVTHTSQGANNIVINDGSTVDLVASKVGTGTVSIGATTAPDAKVTVSSTGDSSTAIGADVTLGAIGAKGGTEISITQKAASSTSGAAADTSNWTVTQSAVTVTGTSTLTTVSVVQDSAATAVNGVAAVAGAKETNVVTFKALTTGQNTQIDGLTYTAAKDLTAAQVAAAFANLSAGATHGPGPVGNGTYSGTLIAGWTSGAASETAVTFTSTTEANVTDLDVTLGGVDPTVVKTDGKAATAATTGVMGVIGGTVAITDGGTDSIATVTLTGYGANSTVTSNVLSSLSLANSAQKATVTNTTATTLGLTVNTLGTGANLVDANNKWTTVNVTATGGNSNLDIDATSVSKLTVSGDKVLTLNAGSSLGGLKTITVSGTAGLTTSGVASATLTSVDASGTSGAVSASIDPGVGTYTGSSGADTVTFVTTAIPTKAVSLGAGDDKLTLVTTTTSSTSLLDGGEGTDTLVMGSDAAVTASAGTAFAEKITGFERLTLSGALTGAGTVNLDNLDGISYVETNNAGAFALTIDKMANNGTVRIGAGAAGTTTVTMKDASGSGDALNLVALGTTNTVTVANVETINLSATATSTVALTASSLTTLNVTGSSAVNLAGSTYAKLTLLDASAMTGALTATTNGTVAQTILGGSGADNLTAAKTGDVLNGGAGNDTLNSAGVSLVTLTGGAGADTFNISTAPANVNAYATITDLGAGDKIQFATGTSFQAAAILLDPDTAVFQDYANTAIVNTNTGDISWFQYNGNTYIIENVSNHASAFQNSSDIIVKIAGLVDLNAKAAFSSTSTGVLVIV